MRERLGSGLRELTRTFEARFRVAQEQGEIGGASQPSVQAELAGAVLHSIALRARAGDSRASLRAFSRAAVKWLCGARPRTKGVSPRGRTRATARRVPRTPA